MGGNWLKQTQTECRLSGRGIENRKKSNDESKDSVLSEQLDDDDNDDCIVGRTGDCYCRKLSLTRMQKLEITVSHSLSDPKDTYLLITSAHFIPCLQASSAMWVYNLIDNRKWIHRTFLPKSLISSCHAMYDERGLCFSPSYLFNPYHVIRHLWHSTFRCRTPANLKSFHEHCDGIWHSLFLRLRTMRSSLGHYITRLSHTS